MPPLFMPSLLVHATAGVLALVLAVVLLVRPTWLRPAAVRGLWLALVVVVLVFLTVAVVIGWPMMDVARRIMDLGLVALAVYMLVRAVQAAVAVRRGEPGWGTRTLDHVGFVAISLFDGFVIVAAIRAGLPTWAVVGIGAGGVVAGIAATNLLKRRPAVAAL